MVNCAVILGRLVADPELKVTPSNVKVTSFTVAVDRNYTKDGERKADFIDVTAWRHTAEFVCKHFRKGSMIAVQGYLQTTLYEDKHGDKRKAVELIADNVSFGADKGRSAPSDENSEFREIPEYDLPY